MSGLTGWELFVGSIMGGIVFLPEVPMTEEDLKDYYVCRKCGDLKHNSQFYARKRQPPNARQFDTACADCSRVLARERLMRKRRC